MTTKIQHLIDKSEVQLQHLTQVMATSFIQMTRLATAKKPLHFFMELDGDLGVGKTTLVRHLLAAMGVKGRIKSPTYAIVETHLVDFDGWTSMEEVHPYLLEKIPISSIEVSHFDFYRFNDPQEWEEAGFRDIFATSGIKIAEWCEKACDFLPTPDVVIRLVTVVSKHEKEIDPETEIDNQIQLRNIQWQANTEVGRQFTELVFEVACEKTVPK